MKQLFWILCLVSLNAFGKNIYVSSTGNNTTGLSPATAFRTIAKLNTMWSSVAAGDFVLFERGQTFYGSIKPTVNGTAVARITIGAFGTGENPVITGLFNLHNWIANGTNRWYCTPDSVTKANCNVFVDNGIPRAVARTRWYSYYSKVAPDGNNSNFRSPYIPTMPNYVGGEVVIRSNVFISEKGVITTQSGNQIFMVNTTQPIYGGATPSRQGFSSGTDSMGFFIQRHMNALDSATEWFYDKPANRFHFYNLTNPNSRTIKVSAIDTLLDLASRQYYTVTDLTFEGAGVFAIHSLNGSAIQIENCQFRNNTKAVSVWNSGDLRVCNNNLNNSFQGGIFVRNRQVRRSMVDSNYITNTGQLIGMGIYNNEFSLRGLAVLHDTTRASNFLRIIGNTVKNSGNGAIYFQGTNAIVRRNITDTFANQLDDMGGIYTFNYNDRLNNEIYTNRIVDSNFISNAIGAPMGSRNGNHIDVAGLYFDDQAQDIFAAHNTIYNIPGNGVQMNTPRDIWLRDNTIYNCLYLINENQREWGLITNMKITKNKMVQKTGQLHWYHVNDRLNGSRYGTGPSPTFTPLYYPSKTVSQSIADLGQIDSNWISNIGTNPYQVVTRPQSGSSYTTLNINQATWKSTYNKDVASISPPITITNTNVSLAVNPKNTDSTHLFPGLRKRSIEGTIYDNFAVIPKWSSLVLIDNGNSPNQPPNADAGADQTKTLPVNTATLSGSGSSDPEAATLTYSWAKTSGPFGGTFSNANIANPTFSFTTPGVYQLTLTVTDPLGAFDTDAMNLTVYAADNLPPTANAGADQEITLPENSVTLSGSGTDPEGATLSYSWARIAGTGTTWSISNGNTATATVNDLDVGTHDFRLSVSDGVNTTTDEVHIVVNEEGGTPNQPPVADAGSGGTIDLPTNTFNLNGSASSDPDGTISTYIWSVLPGSPAGATFSDPNIANPTIGNLVEGTYTVQLLVTDNDGANDNATIQIVVNPLPPNIPPVVEAGENQEIRLPLDTVIVTAVGDDEDSDPATLAYFWNKVSGPGGSVIHNPSLRITKIQFDSAGTYNFRVTATDNRGGTATDQLNIVVLPALIAPSVNAGGGINITLPADSILLSGTATDQDGTISSTVWTKVSGPYGDLIVNPTSLTTKVYDLEEGVHVYELTATDNDGLVSKSRITINVLQSPDKGHKFQGWIIKPNAE